MKLLADLILLISAGLSLFCVLIRVIEAIYQLSQTPNLNTLQKCKQVVINFFRVETYK